MSSAAPPSTRPRRPARCSWGCGWNSEEHRMTRRDFLAAAATSALAQATPKSGSLLYVTEAETRRMREFVRADRAALVERNAAAAMRAGPWSVTFHRPA